MTVRVLQEVVVDCNDPTTLVQFWAAVFGTEGVVRSEEWAYIESPATRLRIAFQRVPEAKSVKNRVHLDVEVDEIPTESARLVGLGAQVVGGIVVDEQGPFQVMRDPEGNEFCLVAD
jgi:predicted enzyme related to lactoylglutathione lyase